jgi:energy-coupling factor transporter ATP-binding protein EcfA2
VKLVGCFDALGAVVELRAARTLAPLLQGALGDLTVDRSPSIRIDVRRNLARRWRLRTDGVTDARPGDADLAFYEAIGVVSDLAAHSAASSDVVLHASSADVAGTAVAIVGPSGAGKSTLAAALALAGHGFLADEVTAVGVDDGAVRPFHRPIGLRREGAAVLGIAVPEGPYDYTFPLRMGGRAPLSDGAPLGVVMILRRHDGDAGCELIEPARALYQLANMTLGATGNERSMFRRVEALVRSVPVHELRCRDVADGVGLIEQVVAGGPS